MQLLIKVTPKEFSESEQRGLNNLGRRLPLDQWVARDIAEKLTSLVPHESRKVGWALMAFLRPRVLKQYAEYRENIGK